MSAVETDFRNWASPCRHPAAPVANYVPFVRTGNLVIISGQLCLGLDGKIAEPTRASSAPRSRSRRARRRRGFAPSTCWRSCGQPSAISTGRALRPSRRLHQRRADLRAACAGHERRLRPDGRGVRRQGPARPLDDRRRGTARSTRRSKSKGCSKSNERVSIGSSRRRSRIAASTTAANGIIENTLSAADAAIARRLRHRVRRAAHRRRRGRRFPRLHARATDGPDRRTSTSARPRELAKIAISGCQSRPHPDPARSSRPDRRARSRLSSRSRAGSTAT